ncbi:Arc family DNA-binding protein [Komagataeibacter rhaeticus]|uniref:Arc family DNA-binding protein n=1 Tax=Komagataeibacter rhaeticus TaxID=215221 RepID=UPI0039E9A342
MKHTDPNFKLRMPIEVHNHLKATAARQQRTMGAHIVFLLRQEMEKEKASGHVAKQFPDASEQ